VLSRLSPQSRTFALIELSKPAILACGNSFPPENRPRS
jgi:hypothetical protein